VTPQQFGDKLRRERERRGVSLQAIAAQTRIGSSLLAGLEKGDCSRWPGGIYARAYLRAYASAVGIDGEDTVALFCEVFPEFARPSPVDPAEVEQAGKSVGRRRLAQLRDLLHRAESRFDLLFRVERS
jgi:cytoskeletal protein RodZ